MTAQELQELSARGELLEIVYRGDFDAMAEYTDLREELAE
jgi:hypothetical protein